MSPIPKKLVCLLVATSLALTSISPAFSASAPTQTAPAPVVIDYGLDSVVAPPLGQLDELARSPLVTVEEGQDTEGGLPLAIILALAGSASAMGFYLYGVLVQHKPFNRNTFLRRGGCGALVGLLGRFIAGRAAAVRIFGAGATGATLAACFG